MTSTTQRRSPVRRLLAGAFAGAAVLTAVLGRRGSLQGNTVTHYFIHDGLGP